MQIHMHSHEVVELRKKLELEQSELSNHLGLYSHNTVSRWEIGLRKPSETLLRLFRLLNDLPKAEAREFIEKLGRYKSKKR